MMQIRILFVATLALAHYAAEGRMDDLFRRLRGIDDTSSDLPVCKGRSEDEFYNIDIEITNLPDECNTPFHLEALGFLIQDIVFEVEELMPQFKGEYLDTKICLLPVSSITTRRILAGTYTYYGTGRCRRCVTQYRVRRLRQNWFLRQFGFGERYLQSDCAEADAVTIEKSHAEAAVKTADTELMDLTEMAQDFQQNEQVKSIIALAESNNRIVKKESTLTSTSAELTLSWCSQAAMTQSQVQRDEYQNNAQKAMTETLDAARRARNALDQVKAARGDMQELISILVGGPGINETVLAAEKAELERQIDNIKAENAKIDAALKALNVTVTVTYADSTSNDKIEQIKAEIEKIQTELKRVHMTLAILNKVRAGAFDAVKKSRETKEKELLTKKAALLEEELRIELAVQTNLELMRLSAKSMQSLYSTSRNFTTDPVLQYALKRVGGRIYGSTSNWDSGSYAEPTSTREEWFAKFARLLIMEIPGRLKTIYNTTNGGCVNISLDMWVIITELESKKEQNTICTSEAGMIPSLTEDTAVTMLSPTASPTTTRMSSPTATPNAITTSRPTTKTTAAPMSSPTVTSTTSPPQTTSPKTIKLESTECLNQDKNLGMGFATPEKCGAAALLDPKCGGDSIMWSDTYNHDWGCRCCSKNEGLASHQHWDVYQYKDEKGPIPVNQNPTATPAATATASPKSSPTAAPMLSPTPQTIKHENTECSKKEKNLGTGFATPETCGAAALLDKDCQDGVFITFNSLNSCNCCSKDNEFFYRSGSVVYQYKAVTTIKYENKECKKQEKNLGTGFATPEKCGTAALLDKDCKDGVFITFNSVSGCRCCEEEELVSRTGSVVYRYKYKK